MFHFLTLLSIVNASLDYRETDWPPLCALGYRQSPINLPKMSDPQLKFTQGIKIVSTDFKRINEFYIKDADPVYLTYDAPGHIENFMTLDVFGEIKEYKLTKIGTKVPSEHAYDFERTGVEFQFQFKETKTGARLIYAARFKANTLTNNEFVAGFYFGIPNKRADIDLSLIINDKKSFYYYEGSDNSPNCEENVTWLVSDLMSVTSVQVIEIRNGLFPFYPLGNARMFRHNDEIEIFYIDNDTKALTLGLLGLLLVFIY